MHDPFAIAKFFLVYFSSNAAVVLFEFFLTLILLACVSVFAKPDVNNATG